MVVDGDLPEVLWEVRAERTVDLVDRRRWDLVDLDIGNVDGLPEQVG